MKQLDNIVIGFKSDRIVMVKLVWVVLDIFT
jgi:hypothetical protein